MEDADEMPGKRSGCFVCDERLLAKKRRLPIIKADDFHHPLFDDVDATGDNEMLPSIHVLNDECMDLILSYFNTMKHFQLGLVCKRWYNLCMSKISRIDNLHVYSFKKLLFGDDFDTIDINAMQKQNEETGHCEIIMKKPEIDMNVMNLMSIVSLNFGTLTTLSLTDIEGLSPASFSILVRMMPNLKELELFDDMKMSEDICQVMADQLIPKLEALSLFTSFAPDNASLQKIIGSARRLRYLSLKETANAEVNEDETWEEDRPGVLEFLAPTVPLVACSLHGYVNLRPKSLEYILRNYSDTLEYLNLSKTNLEGLTNMSTDSLPKLKAMKVFLAAIRFDHVDLEDVPHSLHTRCSPQLVAVLKLMPNLRVLDLSKNYHLRYSGFDILHILSEYCPLLEELHLPKCAIPAEKLVSLTKLKFLKRLVLGEVCENSLNFTEGAIFNLVDCFKFITYRILTQMTNLEELSIEDPYHAFHSDDIVSFIEKAGPRFKRLALCSQFKLLNAMQSGFDTRHNFIEEAVRKCKERCKDRDNEIKLLVHGIGYMHRNSCNTEESRKDCTCQEANFGDIAPEFLRVSDLDVHSEIEYRHFYPDSISQFGSVKVDNGFFKLPAFNRGKIYTD